MTTRSDSGHHSPSDAPDSAHADLGSHELIGILDTIDVPIVVVGIHDRELSGRLRRLGIDPLGLKPRPKGVPMSFGGHQDDALAVSNGRRGEATHGAIEKFLILIELHDVIARPGTG